MVITIIIEGGVLDGANVAASTMNNVENLREEFHRILQSLYEGTEELDIRVVPMAGYKNAIKRFVTRDDVFGLLVDLDGEKTEIPNWFERLEHPFNGDPIVVPQERKKDVYFMIQEMEAWFLKQPNAIYSWAKGQGFIEKHPNEKLENHTMLRGKEVESIKKPSDKLSKLITIFYERETPMINNGRLKGKKRIRVRYTKLKEGAELLAQLNIPMLVASDSELQRLKEQLNKCKTKTSY